MKRTTIDEYLQNTFGINSNTALNGMAITNDGKNFSLDQQLKSMIIEAYTWQSKNIQEQFQGGFIVLGHAPQKRVGLYWVGFNDNSAISDPYASIGSGMDESDRVLYKFIKSLERDQRKNIDFKEGMETLIRATNASSEINQGVGGVPTINYFKKEKITTLKEDESRLATELVKLKDAALLEKDTFYESLENLLLQNKTAEEIEQKVIKTHQQYHKMMQILRGYRI